MTGVVEFSWAKFSVRYAEVAQCTTQPLAAIFFEEAGLYCDNTACSPVSNLQQRELFLLMLTAHLITLNIGTAGAPANPLVGRITSASEGSVSVSVQNDYPPGSAQWFQQTKYGAQFWAASAQFRTMRYVPGQQPIFDPYQDLYGQ